MYLKHLEINGFKSFAHKTTLEFENGMTAVVGPNGCGKSNVSDAIKWVLGEQSAKALRGSKMEDCIFNGTDKAKPMSMAEVSITFTDCENTLKTEYNEVTVARRVFRSGEGQYFINKTPCRLKDIQRLFMDTGIGTSSYSFMEQGRIDRILSSRPEDRRTIFEEASGITKFKADKKEAMRKLEHTEANLLRLADVIHEVKRQIGSLQRQAGKARRYKTIKAELRQYDIYATRQRLLATDKNIENIQKEASSLDALITTTHQAIEELETNSATLRKNLAQTEREIGAIREAGVQAQSKLDYTRDLINTNKQRIIEYTEWSNRDSREIEEIKKSLEQTQKDYIDLATQEKNQLQEQEQAKESLKKANDNLAQHQVQIDSARRQIHELREKSFQLEGLASRLQNQLIEIEAAERSSVIQKERLAAEKSQLARVSTSYNERQANIAIILEKMKLDVENSRNNLSKQEISKTTKTEELKEFQQKRTKLSSLAAAKQAQIELLNDSEAAREGFSDGARLLLDNPDKLDINPSTILGDLASSLDVETEYRRAMGATLCSRLNAILVSDTSTAIEILQKLQASDKGSTSLLALNTNESETQPTQVKHDGDRLIDHVKYPSAIAPVMQRLIGNVLVVDTLQNIPSPIPLQLSYVTKTGCMICGDGYAELWSAEAGTTDPLARKHLLVDNRNSLTKITADIDTCCSAITKLEDEISTINNAITNTRTQLDTKNRALAQKEGETQIIASESREAIERLATVTWELDNILSKDKESGSTNKQTIAIKINETKEQRETISSEINSHTQELHNLENRHSDLHSEATEHRVHFAAINQKLENLQHRRKSSEMRTKELSTTISGRSSGIESYAASIKKLSEDITIAETNLASLQVSVTDNAAQIEDLSTKRQKQATELGQMESTLGNKRNLLEEKRNNKSTLDVQAAENNMRRENQIERITSEYNITIEEIAEEPEPEWKNQQPTLDSIEIMVRELQTKLDAIGAVNLVAIEEHEELEERYIFLVEQDADLTKAKQQLMDMIRKINRTTSEMFQSTFEKVNENFQSMFTGLFNGGSAKLVLVNEEDILECGIDIIARPPGKRLQNVSLLSGGERTLTAVALLFAIYMIKPSPFCLLDELDAALDDTNIGRFVDVLKEFLKHSQFLVITHNRKTIAAANVLYGVTMPERGISNIVSVKFNDQKTADTYVPVLTS